MLIFFNYIFLVSWGWTNFNPTHENVSQRKNGMNATVRTYGVEHSCAEN